MEKRKMLTRPRTHVKSCLAFYRLKKIIIINLHSPCLCFRYLSLYLRPAQKQSCYWNVKWILVSYVLISKDKRKEKKNLTFPNVLQGKRQVGPCCLGTCCLVRQKTWVCFSRKNVLPGGCRMHSALGENTRTVSCHRVAFKCRHDGGNVDSKCAVFMYLRRGCWKQENPSQETLCGRGKSNGIRHKRPKGIHATYQ